MGLETIGFVKEWLPINYRFQSKTGKMVGKDEKHVGSIEFICIRAELKREALYLYGISVKTFSHIAVFSDSLPQQLSTLYLLEGTFPIIRWDLYITIDINTPPELCAIARIAEELLEHNLSKQEGDEAEKKQIETAVKELREKKVGLEATRDMSWWDLCINATLPDGRSGIAYLNDLSNWEDGGKIKTDANYALYIKNLVG